MKRVIFYFDGFNFYNGLKAKCQSDRSWKKFYWINFIAFCEQFIDSNTQELVQVKYFTAPPLSPGKRSRQAALLSANTLLNPHKFKIIRGKYFKKQIPCTLCGGVIEHPEEKRTDVNISVELLMDCFKDKVDKLVLITADSDLMTTIETIRSDFPDKFLKVFFPPKRASADILSLCKPVVFLENNKSKFEMAIMKNIIEIDGKTATKPIDWV